MGALPQRRQRHTVRDIVGVIVVGYHVESQGGDGLYNVIYYNNKEQHKNGMLKVPQCKLQALANFHAEYAESCCFIYSHLVLSDFRLGVSKS